MKLYFYSRELATVVEAKWLTTKFVISGILMGTFLFFGVMILNQSIGNILGFRSTKALAAENNILRQQLDLISIRADKLERQTKQLNERADNIHIFLSSQKNIEDTILKFKIARKYYEPQYLISAAQSSAP
jgi:hypothetical protein